MSGSASQHPYARFGAASQYANPSTSQSRAPSNGSLGATDNAANPTSSSAAFAQQRSSSRTYRGPASVSQSVSRQTSGRDGPLNSDYIIPFGLPPTSLEQQTNQNDISSYSSQGPISSPFSYHAPPQGTSSSSMAITNRPTNTSASSSKDFLVPIGTTGARQKLSIRSPAQKRQPSSALYDSTLPRTPSRQQRPEEKEQSFSSSPASSFSKSTTAQSLSPSDRRRMPSTTSSSSIISPRDLALGRRERKPTDSHDLPSSSAQHKDMRRTDGSGGLQGHDMTQTIDLSPKTEYSPPPARPAGPRNSISQPSLSPQGPGADDLGLKGPVVQNRSGVDDRSASRSTKDAVEQGNARAAYRSPEGRTSSNHAATSSAFDMTAAYDGSYDAKDIFSSSFVDSPPRRRAARESVKGLPDRPQAEKVGKLPSKEVSTPPRSTTPTQDSYKRPVAAVPPQDRASSVQPSRSGSSTSRDAEQMRRGSSQNEMYRSPQPQRNGTAPAPAVLPGDMRRTVSSTIPTRSPPPADSSPSRKDGFKGKFSKLMNPLSKKDGVGSSHRQVSDSAYSSVSPTRQLSRPSRERASGSDMSRSTASSEDGSRSLDRTPSSPTAESAGPAVLPGNERTAHTTSSTSSPLARGAAVTDSQGRHPRAGHASQPSSVKSLSESRSTSFNSSTNASTSPSSAQDSNRPELELKYIGLGDFGSSMPSFGDIFSIGDGPGPASTEAVAPDDLRSLSVPKRKGDKTLPPTPQSDSPVTPRGSSAQLPVASPITSASNDVKAAPETQSQAASRSRKSLTETSYVGEDEEPQKPSRRLPLPPSEPTAEDVTPVIPDANPSAPMILRPVPSMDDSTLSRVEAIAGPGALSSAVAIVVAADEQIAPAAKMDIKEVGRATDANSIKPSSSNGIDPKVYVPPGALSRTRKGTTVGDGRSATKADKDVAPGSLRRPTQSRFSFSSSADGGPSPLPSASCDTAFGNDSSYDVQETLDEEMTESIDHGSTVPASAWVEVEQALLRFRDPSDNHVEKGSLIRNILLPFLALEAETPNVKVSDGLFRSAKARRSLFFDWIAHLLIELQHVQTSADRGAILESIACIIESRNLSVGGLADDPVDEAKFSSTFGHILLYAIGELNKKGVYQNTLIFSGRLLAVAFFRVNGVASKLLRALPINRFALDRVAAEAEWEKKMSAKDFDVFVRSFPASLRELCFYDARAYLEMLDMQSSLDDDSETDRYLVRQKEVEVEMTGNWLRRWQSDDSELFFSFCRSYHRQLAALLTSTAQLRRRSRLFFGSPGYAHLATCIHLKCLSLVNRDILSVTTISSQKNFNPGETANVLSGSTAGKPRHLEAANRRCTAIIVDIVRAPGGNDRLYLPMLSVLIKCLVKRTSLYDVQGVFCLLDWLDGVLGHMDAAELPIESVLDIDFLIETIGLILENADHALALMRTIAFSYSNFGILIGTNEHRKQFCENILLNRKVFHKLFLSWSFTIRAYFLHLLVFRLARISDFPNPPADPKGKSAVRVAKIFNRRLDEIRNRHDELDPSSSGAGGQSGSREEEEVDEDDNDGNSVYSRIKGRPLSFVSTIKQAPSVHKVESPGLTKAERLLGIGLPDPILAKNEPKSQSKAARWLRALGAKGNSKSGKVGDSVPLSPPRDAPTISNQPRMRMRSLAELDSEGEDNDTSSDAAMSRDPSSQADPDDSTDRPMDGGSLHGDHIAPDTTFDLQSPNLTTGAGVPAMGRNGSARVSRAFSRRASILPAPALELVQASGSDEDLLDSTTIPDVPPIPGQYKPSKDGASGTDKAGVGYSESLQIYAGQGLREWEAVLAEHDEFFATMVDQNGPPAVPRLPVQWPAMWSD